jgi:hypothetical protein
MTRLATAIVCLGCLAVAANGEALFPHAQPSEQLDYVELQTKLSEIGYHLRERKSNLQTVVDVLYAAKDKNSYAAAALKVADLIRQNDISLQGCSKGALKERAGIHDAVRPYYGGPRKHLAGGVQYAVAIYTLAAIHQAATYCLEHKDQVIAAEINDEEWMEGLKWAWKHDGGDFANTENDVHTTGQSNLYTYVKSGSSW